MRPPRSTVHPLGRVLLVGAAAAAVVVGAAQVPEADPGPAPEPGAGREVTAQGTALVCPGDPFVGGEGTRAIQADGGVVAVPAPADVLEGVVPGGRGSGETTISPGTARGGKDAARTIDGLPGRPVTVTAKGAQAPGLVASQHLQADGEDGFGLAVTPCTQPQADLWLVAGGGEAGRQERLVLTNTGANPATVDLTFLTDKGEEQPGGGQGVVVPAGERTELLLDGLSGTRGRQVVHVEATGGLVTAAVSDVWHDGLVPAGAEVVTPTAAPARRLVLPGNVNGAKRGLVVGAPGTQDAVVKVSAVSEGRRSSVDVVTVPAGRVAPVDLPRVDGVHSWLVESDVPVVAGGWMTTEGGTGGVRDLSWSVATPEIDRLGGAALPAGLPEDVRRFVEVVAPDDEAVTVEVLVRQGSTTTVEKVQVEAGRSRAIQVGRAAAVWVRPPDGTPVHAAVVLTRPSGDRVLSSVPVLPGHLSVRDVPVLPAP